LGGAAATALPEGIAVGGQKLPIDMIIFLCESGRVGWPVRKTKTTGRMDLGHAQIFDIGRKRRKRRSYRLWAKRTEARDRPNWAWDLGEVWDVWVQMPGRNGQAESGGVEANPSFESGWERGFFANERLGRRGSDRPTWG